MTHDGSLLLPGSFALHDLPELGVGLGDLTQGPYPTIAGLILARLRYLPQHPGDSIHRHAVTALHLRSHQRR